MSDTYLEGIKPYVFPVPDDEALAESQIQRAQSRTLVMETGGAIAMNRPHSGSGLQSFNVTGSACRPQIVVRELNIVFDGSGQVSFYE